MKAGPEAAFFSLFSYYKYSSNYGLQTGLMYYFSKYTQWTLQTDLKNANRLTLSVSEIWILRLL